jgi:hypothetical protein
MQELFESALASQPPIALEFKRLRLQELMRMSQSTGACVACAQLGFASPAPHIPCSVMRAQVETEHRYQELLRIKRARAIAHQTFWTMHAKQ